MVNVFLYSLLSVIIVSLVSLIGIATLSLRADKLKRILLYLVSFAAGALMGDVFIHLLPEVSGNGFSLGVSAFALSGILFSFVIEKFVHWRHCHLPTTKEHPHPFAVMNLVGDGVHNFVDGIIIGVSYLVSIPVGLATTLAVFLHEIPQEIGDFSVLLHGGFSRGRALFMNFLLALTAVLGVLIVFFLRYIVEGTLPLLTAFAAGTFLYIAGSDLIPELHKETGLGKTFIQLVFFVLGIAIMYLLLFLD